MCTLSWRPLADGYVLFFNRDERRSRSPAVAPSLQHRNAVPFLAPTDTAAGGTWLLVNTFGVSIGLLNNYASTPADGFVPQQSRGMLPLMLADCVNPKQAMARARESPLHEFAPFHLVIADANEASYLSWDGYHYRDTALESSGDMLTTSFFATQAVTRARRTAFSRLVGDMETATTDSLFAFHSYRGVDTSSGIVMSRPDACTHSISGITVSLARRKVQFTYMPQAEISPGSATQVCHLDLA